MEEDDEKEGSCSMTLTSSDFSPSPVKELRNKQCNLPFKAYSLPTPQFTESDLGTDAVSNGAGNTNFTSDPFHHSSKDDAGTCIDDTSRDPLQPTSQDSQVFGVTSDDGTKESPSKQQAASGSGSPRGDHSSPFKFGDARSGDMRHQLLTQRTFNSLEDNLGPRTSSPMRKIRVYTTASGIQTVTISPSSGSHVPALASSSDGTHCSLQQDHASHQVQGVGGSPFLTPRTDHVLSSLSQEHQAILKTPVRGQQCHWENGMDVTPSHFGTPMRQSPGFTPGRHFVNPFEVDPTQMHLSMFSPNLFKVTNSAKKEKEGFWSVEHAALIKPVEINDSEVIRQHRYQQRIDKEQDPHIQMAINKFFSNELIVPSPWSEKVKHVLPRTPGAIKSVSSQTTLSVPPHVDLLAELGDKYQLPQHKTEASPASECGNSFIRRRLLSQLNDDSVISASPGLPSRSREEGLAGSPSPGKQTTPEWERKTPKKAGSGHFSSSPIRTESGDRQPQSLSGLDLLASPELSPIAGRASRSVRSSGVFFSHQEELDSPRAIMQLDFSSILDDADEEDEDVADKTETLVQTGHQTDMSCSEAPACATSVVLSDSQVQSNQSKNNSLLRGAGFLSSALSAESASDVATTTFPQSSSNSQDTGYNTASQCFPFDLECNSNSNLITQDTQQSNASAPPSEMCSSVSNFKEGAFASINRSKEKSMELTESFTNEQSRGEMNFGSNRDSFIVVENIKHHSVPIKMEEVGRKRDTCLLRKVRTLSDIRASREKSSVSRDLTQSFNSEKESYSNMSVEDKPRSSSDVERYSMSFDAPSGSTVPLPSTPSVFNCDWLPSGSDKKTGTGSVCVMTHEQLENHCSNDNMLNASPLLNISVQSQDAFQKNTGSPVRGSIAIATNQSSSTSRILYSPAAIDMPVSPFVLGDDQTLVDARELLSKSEQLRKKLSGPDWVEPDSIFQGIDVDVENRDPSLNSSDLNPEGSWQSGKPGVRSLSPTFRVEPMRTSTPSPVMLKGVREKIEDVRGNRLGSEIAAEILKRAGEDLAELTNRMGPSDSL
ncbi:uncharacterized protein LOC101854495 [Aplysia californica]|uniref:Protein aurora borealis n=1 Tax=Aplysia californica TaxID=6500 RepID=A0ABM0ZYS9_APLCA|nr:uncharacterized protein LOC101854495 [Aplysia californica]XP_012937325.1 uncharacterized protein LOC101854495 [Aplysia californica]